VNATTGELEIDSRPPDELAGAGCWDFAHEAWRVRFVGRGAPEGFADPHEFQIAATNLTATKARLLLMACLMRFGSYPPAKDPDHPTAGELSAIRAAVAVYQKVFDTH